MIKKSKKSKKQKNTKTISSLSIGDTDDRAMRDILNKRRRLMWLGVILSSIIVVTLWFCSWQFKAPVLSSQPIVNNNQLENLAKDLGQTMAEIKGSLANINQAIGQTNSSEATNQAEEKVKVDILSAVKEKSEDIASSTNKNIFQK